MITYKENVLKLLKDSGYSTYRLRREKILGEATIQCIRSGQPVSWDKLDLICRLLDCQPGDLLVCVKDSGAEQTLY